MQSIKTELKYICNVRNLAHTYSFYTKGPKCKDNMRRHLILFDIQREEWSYHNLEEEHNTEVRGNFGKNQNTHNTYRTRCVKLYKTKELLVFASALQMHVSFYFHVQNSKHRS